MVMGSLIPSVQKMREGGHALFDDAAVNTTGLANGGPTTFSRKPQCIELQEGPHTNNVCNFRAAAYLESKPKRGSDSRCALLALSKGKTSWWSAPSPFK